MYTLVSVLDQHRVVKSIGRQLNKASQEVDDDELNGNSAALGSSYIPFPMPTSGASTVSFKYVQKN